MKCPHCDKEINTNLLHPLEALLLSYKKAHKSWMGRYESFPSDSHKIRYERYVATITALEKAIEDLEKKG